MVLNQTRKDKGLNLGQSFDTGGPRLAGGVCKKPGPHKQKTRMLIPIVVKFLKDKLTKPDIIYCNADG